MDDFWARLVGPFVLFAMLLVAWPFKRAIQLKMRPGKLKRLLLADLTWTIDWPRRKSSRR